MDSDSSKANLVMSFASWKVAGSIKGRSPSLAMKRESSSLVDERAAGSSAVTKTSPPAPTPERFRFKIKSEATLTPFCFIALKARRPEKEAAEAASSATFSLTDHST